jgi:membrane associated rhomboid family serine protease
MDVWAVVALMVIVGGIALSLWRKFFYTIVASLTCVVVFAFQQMTDPIDYMSFMPHDLTDSQRIYTLLTSMYAHSVGDLSHLLFNIVVLVFIGLIFEQRIGTRPFVVLYLLSGLFGTLAFAAYYWNNPEYSVYGASGAITGILGGFARLYPNERMMFMLIPYPIRAVYVVLIIVLLQLVFMVGPSSHIAWQSHLAGLAAGVLFAPLVIKLRPEHHAKVKISLVALRKLAVTPELKTILQRIESEEVPDVRKAWVSHFISKAKCPTCGATINIAGDSVRCSKGHIL